MRKLNFAEKIGGKTLSVSYYQDKRLKKIQSLKKNVSPIYFRIVYNGANSNVRSILWKSLMDSHNEFIIGQIFKEGNKTKIVEGLADIESNYINDKQNFEYLCKYEFECLKRIIVFACGSQPENVQKIINAYEFWGKDGLREASSRMLELLFELYSKSEKDFLKHDPVSPAFSRILEYRHPSRNAINYLESLYHSNFDSVGLLSFAHEIGIDKIVPPISKDDWKTKLPNQLREDYDRLIRLITNLAHQYSAFPIDQEKFKANDLVTTDDLSQGMLYFPKIHFFYPIFKDQAGLMDLLKLQRLLSKT